MGEEWMIQTVDLRVDYGDVTAVDHVGLKIGAGEIYGLIGPNGAGKTSTIRVLATLQEPTYGEVMIAGLDIRERRADVHRVLGYMPDFAPVYDKLRVLEFLELFAGAYGVPRSRASEVLEQVDLADRAETLAGTLSRGLQQRLVLGKTLLHDPKVMLLDEPASGLDPMARIELRRVLKAQAAAGKTILISSHILSELSGFCTSFGIMASGRLRFSGDIEALDRFLDARRRYIVELLTPSSEALGVLRECENVEGVKREEDGARFELQLAGGDEEASGVLAAMIGEGLRVKAFYTLKADVEDAFLKIGAEDAAEKRAASVAKGGVR